MNDFKSYKNGLQLAPPPANIRIQWLPIDTISRFQPLDLGIIANLKVSYRRQFLRYLITEFKLVNDPVKRMDLYNTCLWVTRAWSTEVSNSTIYNCFRKCSILQSSPISLPNDAQLDITTLYNQACQAGSISNAIQLSDFLNPVGEDASITEGELSEDPLSDIIAHHIQDDLHPELEEEVAISTPNISPNDALRAMQLLLRFYSRLEGAQVSNVRALQRIELCIQQKVLPDT